MHYVEIDDEMVEIIIDLNHKGYITRNCCAGHIKRRNQPMTTYVQFQKTYPFSSIPSGFYLEEQETDDGIVNNVIRTIPFQGNRKDGFYAEVGGVILSQETLEDNRKAYINELKKWSYNLENIRKVV
ncbi:hypothetical protein AALA24_13825 [Anaerovoracaceae bacterium 42-11]